MTPRDLVSFSLGVVICATGVAAFIGHLLRPQPKDRMLLWLGGFAACYGLRLMVEIGPVGVMLFGREPRAFVIAALNYIILIPAGLFAEELYGTGWRRSLRWLTLATAGYAVIAIAVDVAAGDASKAPDPALILFMPGLVAVVVAGAVKGYRPTPFPEWRILFAGSAAFLAFVLHEHAVEARLLPWDVHVEPIGFLAFVISLGWVAVMRFYANQRQLIAFDKEMESARQIQSSILPQHLPRVSGVALAARYVPLAAVAGDFYDVIRREDGGLLVLVADVSGHGVPAALIASMVKVAFVAESSRAGDPAAILGGMNQTLCGLFDRAYVTAVCIRVDRERETVSYAIAGHPPPLAISRTGIVTRLDERGMFLGMFPHAGYATATVPMGVGDRLIIYSDGVTETPHRTTDDLFGIDRLSACARTERERPASAFIDSLLATLETFTGQSSLAHDDLTVVVVDIVAN